MIHAVAGEGQDQPGISSRSDQQKIVGSGTWVAQLVKRLPSAQVMILESQN